MSPALQDITRAAEIIRRGGLVAFPTETVYGLGADAFNPAAVERIFAVKGRPAFNPLIVHIHSPEQLDCLTSAPKDSAIITQVRKLSVFWPGPLSLVIPRAAAVPGVVSAGLDSVAVRIPDHPVALEFLRAADTPIAAPSANPSGYVSPTTAEHVAAALKDQVDAILDGGPCRVGIESTVLSLLTDPPRLLRPGAVTLEELVPVIGPVEKSEESAGGPQLSPGRLLSHYAPHTRVFLRSEIDPSSLPSRTALVSFGSSSDCRDSSYSEMVQLSPQGDLEAIARQLFAALRALDSRRFDAIVVDTCPETGLGLAIMDRLRRAAARK